MAFQSNSPNNFTGIRRGPRTNSVREAFRSRAAMERFTASQHKMRRVIVHAYHHATQTVDVVPIDEPAVSPILGVPIRNGGVGTLRIIQPLVGIVDDEANPDTGYLLYTDTDSERHMEGVERAGGSSAVERSKRHVTTKNRPIGAEFWPGAHHNSEALPERIASDGLIKNVGPNDAAIVFGEMAIIFRRDRGDGKSQIVRVADDIVDMTPEQLEADLKKVGRDSDGSVTSISASGILRSG